LVEVEPLKQRKKLDADKETLCTVAAADNDAEKTKHGHKLTLTGKLKALSYYCRCLNVANMLTGEDEHVVSSIFCRYNLFTTIASHLFPLFFKYVAVNFNGMRKLVYH